MYAYPVDSNTFDNAEGGTLSRETPSALNWLLNET